MVPKYWYGLASVSAAMFGTFTSGCCRGAYVGFFCNCGCSLYHYADNVFLITVVSSIMSHVLLLLCSECYSLLYFFFPKIYVFIEGYFLMLWVSCHQYSDCRAVLWLLGLVCAVAV